MLHSTLTLKKLTNNSILKFGMAGLLSIGLLLFAPYRVTAEVVPSAENTDAGEITLHFTHYNAQDLEFYLNTDQAALAYTDATLTFQDSTMEDPITVSYLSDDGSYVLYQKDSPVEELDGTFSISMVTEPGYQLDLDQISFYVNGQAVPNGGSVVITDSSAAMTSLIYCSAIPETPVNPEPSFPEEPAAPAEPAAPENPVTPENPSVSEKTEAPVEPAISETPAESLQTEVPAVSAVPNSSDSVQPSVSAAALTSPEQVPIAAEPIANTVSAEDVVSTSTNPSSAANPADAGHSSISNQIPASRQIIPAGKSADPGAPVLSSEAAVSSEDAALSRNVTETRSGIASWLHQRTNQILAVMIAVILLLILIESLLALKDSMHQKRSHRFY